LSWFAESVDYLVMLGILSVLIIVHECGHFSVARFFKFQTPVFGFGLPFGPHIVVARKWGTEFRIHALLLGGFVAIPELGDESNQDAFGIPMMPFRKFPIWQRALVAFAGVGFNMIFAYFIMLFVCLWLGQPISATAVASLPPENPIAATAGIKVDDELVKIDNVTINSPDDAVMYLTSHKSTLVHVNVLRDKKPMEIDMTTNANGKVGMGLAPKGPVTYKKVEGNFFEVAWFAFAKLCTLTWSMISALGDMISQLFHASKPAAGHPKLGIQDLHGVFAVIKIGHDMVQQDWRQLFLFTIMISMDLAIINLFPWPALDGWHLATMMLEGVRGRPMGERAQGELVKWGFITLLALMALIMFNDVTALVQGKLDFKLKGDQTTDKDKDKAKSSKDGTTPGDSAKTDSPTTTATDSSTSTSSSGTNSTSDSSSTSSQSKTEETVPSK
jgi:regulator of sigma E protease